MRHESKRHMRYHRHFFFLSRQAIDAPLSLQPRWQAIGSTRRSEGWEKKEVRFPIQRRWLSATLSTFGKIITRFVERRRLSRKKLPISNLGSRPGRLGRTAASIRHADVFFSSFFISPPEEQTTFAAARNFSFFRFFFHSCVLIQLFETRDTTRANLERAWFTRPAAVMNV